MGIFDSLRPAPQSHPEFGPLEYARGHWHGTVALDDARIALHLPGSRSGPDPDGLEIAKLAPRWWAAVKSAVVSELFDHYSAGREGGLDELPGMAAATDVWTHVAISSVQVKPYRSIDELQVALRAAWDEEHTLGALIRGGTLVELNGSILEPR
jgi:hypothetical protein